MTRRYTRRPLLGLDHYVWCAALHCMTAAVIYAGNAVPLCMEHAESSYDHLHHVMKGRPRKPTVRRPPSPPRPARPSIVYYALCGDEVKIGHTSSPKRRWARLKTDFPGLTILVVEPGGLTEELARHAEFVHLRSGQSERFRFGADLQAHIGLLQLEWPSWQDLARQVHGDRAEPFAVP